MLIPTRVDSSAVIAVPGIDYWAETASHFVSNTFYSEIQTLTKLSSIIILQVYLPVRVAFGETDLSLSGTGLPTYLVLIKMPMAIHL
jgi:hypothetical protein